MVRKPSKSLRLLARRLCYCLGILGLFFLCRLLTTGLRGAGLFLVRRLVNAESLQLSCCIVSTSASTSVSKASLLIQKATLHLSGSAAHSSCTTHSPRSSSRAMSPNNSCKTSDICEICRPTHCMRQAQLFHLRVLLALLLVSVICDDCT